jgi:hypothetical protein
MVHETLRWLAHHVVVWWHVIWLPWAAIHPRRWRPSRVTLRPWATLKTGALFLWKQHLLDLLQMCKLFLTAL